MFRATIIVATVTLAGCMTQRPPIMIRIDGRSAGSSPALEMQAKQDMAICKGEASKAQLSAHADVSPQLAINVYVGCMAGRGYVVGPEGTKPAVTQ